MRDRKKEKIISISVLIGLIAVLIIIVVAIAFKDNWKTDVTKNEDSINETIDKDNNVVLKSNLTKFNEGISLFNNSNFVEAYNKFEEIGTDTYEYEDALKYINKCKEKLVEQVINEANKLVDELFYTKALDTLNKYQDIIGDEEVIKNRINEIEKLRLAYVNKELNLSEDVKITENNINDIDLNCTTGYLTFVNLDEQKVFVYTGQSRDWTLVRSFECSSGIKGEETPIGNFFVENRGEDFYSEDYDQGAKYWVGFVGNYLFHSLPYDKEFTQIVDPTIGEPASHGCIRLKEEDSKWLYENLPQGSRVIIR